MSENIEIKSYKDWKNFDTEGFSKEFRNTNWKRMLALNEKDPNKSFRRFREILDNLITKFVPVKEISKKRQKINNQPWITKGILKAISIKNKNFKKFVKAIDVATKTMYHERYKNYRNQIVTLIRQSKINYYEKYFSNNMKNSKNTWKGINQLIGTKQNHSNNILTLKINEQLTSDSLKVAEHFIDFFTSIATKIRKKIPNSIKRFESYLNNSSRHSFFFSPTDSQQVTKIIRNLDPKKSTGPNSIPHQVIDNILPDISKVLADLFNVSLETGVFPELLKIVKVISVFKNKGSATETSNYRPISLLSNIDKLFEKIVHEKITTFLNKHLSI